MYDRVAADGMGGWEGEGDEANDPQDASAESIGTFGAFNGDTWWEPCTGAISGYHEYKLDKEDHYKRWLQTLVEVGTRLTLGPKGRVTEIDGVRVTDTELKNKRRYDAEGNQGLGLYNRRGRAVFYRNADGIGQRTYKSRVGCLPQFSTEAEKLPSKNPRNAPEICLRPLGRIYLVVEGDTPVRTGGGVLGDRDFRRFCPRLRLVAKIVDTRELLPREPQLPIPLKKWAYKPKRPALPYFVSPLGSSGGGAALYDGLCWIKSGRSIPDTLQWRSWLKAHTLKPPYAAEYIAKLDIEIQTERAKRQQKERTKCLT